MSDNTLTVLIVEPMKMPYTRQIPDTLQAMQKIVGGDIEAVYPHDGPVALVCGREGKSTGMQPNRFLCLENGKPYDVVCGTFFLDGIHGESFVSLTPEQIRRYRSIYSRGMVMTRLNKGGKKEHER